MRRLSVPMLAAFAFALSSAGCMLNASEDGANPTPGAEQVSPQVAPVSPNAPQGALTVQPTTEPPSGDGLQTMDLSQPSAPPPRPWDPHPGAAPNAIGSPESTTKPKIGGAKEDDGSKPTK